MPSPTYQAKSTKMSSRTIRKSPSRKDERKQSDAVPFDFTNTNTFSPVEQFGFLSSPVSDPAGDRWSPKERPRLGHSRSGSNFQSLSYSQHRLSTGPSILMSSMSSMPSLKQSPRKSSGGLKSTIKRMFGSKRHRIILDEERKQYHRSDPGNLTAGETSPSYRGSPSVSSRPRTALKAAALHSHAVNPSSAVRDFQNADTGPDSINPKRRNTLPSLAFTDHEAQSFSMRLGSLMTDDLQEATRHETKSLNKDKRRSRSADALAEKYLNVSSKVDTRQDRESEIAYWRNSLLLNPLHNSASTPVKTLSTKHSNETAKETRSLDHLIHPSHGFDFGLNDPAEDPADLEERVSTLEVKMFDFEYAIARLQGIEMPKPALPMKQMKRRNVQEVFSKPSIRSLSTAASGPEVPPITPGDSPVLSNTPKETPGVDRTSNATTVRPFIRNTSPARSSLRLTAEQYENLLAMIQDEKDARQLMEMQILDLQKEIELLQTPVYATIKYPPSGSNNAGSTQKKLHRSPPFRINRPPVRETSRFSMAESDIDSINEGFQEAFQTPHQRQPPFGHTTKDSSMIGIVT